MSTRIRLTRTVPVTPQARNGTQAAHVDCVFTHRLPQAIATFRSFLRAARLNRTISDAQFNALMNRRWDVRNFIDIVRPLLIGLLDGNGTNSAVISCAATLADLLNTDEIDLTVVQAAVSIKEPITQKSGEFVAVTEPYRG